MKTEIWIVTIDSHRFFDECEYSYLPIFHKIFGVYNSKAEAEKAVWSCFGDDKYEYILPTEIMDTHQIYHDIMFKYVDKEYGGYAIYGIDYHMEFLKNDGVTYETTTVKEYKPQSIGDTTKYIKWNALKKCVEVKDGEHHFFVINMPNIKCDWVNAHEMCKNFGGYLPNIDELKVLYNNIKDINKCIWDNKGFTLETSLSAFYWSSTETENNKSSAQILFASNGITCGEHKHDHIFCRAITKN